MPQNVTSTDVAAWIGAGTGCLGILLWLLAIFQQHRQHKAERKEEVSGSVQTEAGHLHVLVYNSGRIPIYLKHVDLIWKTGGVTKQIPLFIPHEHRPLDGAVVYQDTRMPSTDEALEVGDEERFMLTELDYPTLQSILKLWRWSYWISIRSAGGEIARIKGRYVRPHLLSLEKIGHSAKRLPVALVVPEISATIGKWSVTYLGGKDAWNELNTVRRERATDVVYFLRLDLFSKKSVPVAITSLSVRFMKEDQLLLDHAPNDTENPTDPRKGFPTFTLPPRETYSISTRGYVLTEDVPKMKDADRVVLFAKTDDGDEFQWPIGTVNQTD